MKSTLRTDFSEVKSVFGFRVRLGNPDLDFENLNPDFPIKRTHRHYEMYQIDAKRFKVGLLASPIKRSDLL